MDELNGFFLEVYFQDNGRKSAVVPLYVAKDDFKKEELCSYIEKAFGILEEREELEKEGVV